jgi:pimeloyl-ACP methyl ester carboxylesterase
MNQFHFGTAERPLYGVHHEPVSRELRQSAVLICYPFAREYMRCHRALVRFCDRLAGSGYHCLRFDYFGTGDSAGENGDGNVDEWINNTRSAAQELRHLSGLEKITIVGVRLGAAIALLAAAEDPKVEALVLWDPVVDGNRYIDRLEALHAEFVMDADRFPKTVGGVSSIDGDELIGMVCPRAMRQSIRDIRLAEMPGIESRLVSIIATEDLEEFRALERAKSQLPKCQYKVVNERTAWDTLAELGAILMPHELLQTMVDTVVAADCLE